MSQQASPRAMAWADGGTIFAAVLLTTMGVFQALQGLAALANDEVFTTAAGYTFDFDLTTYGWAHVIVGAIAILVGLSMLMGQTWALIAGILLAMLSALANFVFIPYFPVWAIVLIALDIFIIWSISTVWEARR